MLVYQEANADAHQVEPVEKILDAALDVVQRHVLGCGCLLHLHQSMSHRLHHGQVPSLYVVQPLRETTPTAPTNTRHCPGQQLETGRTLQYRDCLTTRQQLTSCVSVGLYI